MSKWTGTKIRHKICATVIFILTFSYINSCRRSGSFLIKSDELIHSDAIVYLMGSITDRMLHAVDLYNSGKADKLILVEGPNDGYKELRERGADMISGTKQAANIAVALGIPQENILILPGGAQSTQEEAIIIRDYLSKKPELDTLILVSSSPHMRRAYMIFNTAFKKSGENVKILCSPSPYTQFNPDKWWKSKDGIETVVMEYVKIANFVLFERRDL